MTTAFARHLELAPDDSMEVSSSPAGNQYDDEVLIDYDEYNTAALTEDEQMVEDGEFPRPGTATDDMMEDAEPNAPVNEEIMQDDPVPAVADSYIQDEELIDYSDEDYQDDTQVTLEDATVDVIDVAADSSTLPPTENVIEPEHVDDAIVQHLEDAAAGEEPTANFLSAVETDHVSTASAGDEDTAAAAAGLGEHATAHVDQDGAADELSRQVDEEEAAAQELEAQAFEAEKSDAQATDGTGDQPAHDETEVLKHPPRFPSGLDTSAYFAPDGPQTPSDTGIHPIMIRYDEIVMPLFKSRVQADGLLKDDNLASVSLGDLLDNCRHRLAVKIGVTVSADEELVLSFENMGLQLVEHSPQAFETSLEDVLGVYLRLHQNDSTHPIPPLALSLSVQLKFTSSFNTLKAAAEQGDGMSKFASLRSGVEELDEYEGEEGGQDEDAKHEQFEDHEAIGEEQHYEGDETFAEDHADGEASYPEEGQEYDPQDQEGTQEYDAGQSYEGHEDDTNFEEYDEQHPTDPNAEPDHGGNDGETLEGGPNAAEGSQHVQSGDAPEDEADYAQESEETVQPESTASSTTVRGDVANDGNGEYFNEDFIDFEDDDLTPYPAEPHADDGTDDFSALASEHDAEANADATAFDDVQEHAATDVAGEVSVHDPSPKPHSAEEFNGDEADEDRSADETHDETANDADQHGQDEDPPADNLDLNEDALGSAFDLFEGHDLEDGAENGDASSPADALEFDDDDDIGFNDDVDEEILATNSPLGKRSFDEHVGKDDVAEKPELKRARS